MSEPTDDATDARARAAAILAKAGDTPYDGPPLVSIMATRTRHVELGLAVLTMGLMTLIGLLLVGALIVAGQSGAQRVPAAAVGWASAGLIVGGVLGWAGSARGWRRGTPMMPWALAGAAVWLVMTLWAFGRLGQ